MGPAGGPGVWKAVKVLVCAIGATLALVQLPETSDFVDMSWRFVPVLCGLTMIGLVLVLGIQAISPWSARQWLQPTWDSNPFNLAQPLSWFHMAGWFFVSSGAGLVTAGALGKAGSLPAALLL